jgi:nucleotide-binding universal stress UspA family protein
MINILVPYDFSKMAVHALDFATKLSATYSKLHITLIHVVELPLNTNAGTLGGGIDPLSDYQNQVYFRELLEQRKKELDQLHTKYSSPNYRLDTEVQVGNVFREISTTISEKKPDLVVMGSSGTSGWEEFWIGSTTEKIVRNAPCPVITIKGATDPSQLKKVVFASSFDELDGDLAARIKNMQQVFDAQFERVHTEIYNSLSEESGILEFADDIGADLIAMATHGRTGILHLLTGSIAEDVVNHSKRPVWTLRAAHPKV